MSVIIWLNTAGIICLRTAARMGIRSNSSVLSMFSSRPVYFIKSISDALILSRFRKKRHIGGKKPANIPRFFKKSP